MKGLFRTLLTRDESEFIDIIELMGNTYTNDINIGGKTEVYIYPRDLALSITMGVKMKYCNDDILSQACMLFDSGSFLEKEGVLKKIKGIPKPSTVDRACKMIQGRANVGEVKYGVSIDRDDLTASEWAQHAIEELLDGAQYLIRLKDEMEALQEENAELKQELKRNQKQELTDEISLIKNLIKNGLTINDYLASIEKSLELVNRVFK